MKPETPVLIVRRFVPRSLERRGIVEFETRDHTVLEVEVGSAVFVEADS